MAFGSGSATGVARADVEFRAETGKFEADVTQAKRIYMESVGQMSDASLRLGVAQEKLDRAISRFGPTSLQARNAAVAYRRELQQVQHSEQGVERSALAAHAAMVRSGRGAIAASGAFKGLGNALFFASGAFAGAFGIVYALRSTFDAAKRSQLAIAQMSQAVRNSGISWQDNRKHILAALEAQSKLSAFDDEELKQTFGALIIRTKNVDTALKLNALSADIARARHITLQQAMVLVTRASLGQTASLRRLGIDVQKVTTEQDKLRAAGVKVTFAQRQQAKAADAAATQLSVVTQLQAKFQGQASTYAHTAAGRQEYFNKLLEDTKEIIGTALLPTFNHFLDRANKYLENLNRSGRLQKEINQDLKDAGVILHGVGDAFDVVRAVLGPVVDLVGGLHNAVEFLLLGTLAYKVGLVTGALKLLRVGFATTATVAETSAARAIAAENAIGDAAVVNAGKVGILSRALMGIGGLAGLTGTAALVVGGVAVADVAAIVAAGGGGGARNSNWKKYPNVVTLYNKLKSGKPLSQAERTILASLPKDASLDTLSDAQLKALDKALSHVYGTDMTTAQAKAGAQFTPTAPAGPPPPKGGSGGQGAPPPRTEADIQLDIARATANNDIAGELKYNRELLAFYRKKAAALEARKHLTQLQKQQLQQLYNEIESVNSTIDSIVSGQNAKAKAASAARASAARKRHQHLLNELGARENFLETQLMRAAATAGTKDDAIWAAALIKFYRNAARNQDLTDKERSAYLKKIPGVQKKLKTARAKATQGRLDIQEQKLRNAVDAAVITDGLKDDEAALRRLIAFYKKLEHNDNLSEKQRLAYQRKRIAAQKKLATDLKKDAKASAGATNISAMEFLSSLKGTLDTYGGNLFGPNDLSVGGRAGDTHTVLQTGILRDQTRVLKSLAGRLRFPTSNTSYTNMTSLFDGYAT